MQGWDSVCCTLLQMWTGQCMLYTASDAAPGQCKLYTVSDVTGTVYTVYNGSQNLHSGSQNLKAILLSDLLVRITFIAITNTDFCVQVTVWILLPPLRNVHFSSRCVVGHNCLSLDLCCTQGSSWLLLLDTMNPSGLLHHT